MAIEGKENAERGWKPLDRYLKVVETDEFVEKALEPRLHSGAGRGSNRSPSDRSPLSHGGP